MDKETIKKHKYELESEKKLLEQEMDSIGCRDPQNPDHWEVKAEEMDTDQAEATEQADAIEAYGENAAVLNRLQQRYDHITSALQAIEEGRYGVCSVCEQQIEKARLVANPAALTCIKHRDKG